MEVRKVCTLLFTRTLSETVRHSNTARNMSKRNLKPAEGSAGEPAHVLDGILWLPLPYLKQHLDAATSDELRILCSFMWLGKAGTKEANKMFIFDEVAKRRAATVD